MAIINNKLIHFKSKSNFNSRYAESTDDGVTFGDFLGTSIVFIQDAKEIWTHGQFFKCISDAEFEKLSTIGDVSLLETTIKDNLVNAVNELKNSIEDIRTPYQVDLQALLSASDTESISAAIGTIQELNNVVSENRAIVGSVASGTVGVSIRVLGNVTSLYYILDTVLGYTVNEINITNDAGTLSKQVVTHAFITEDRVINSLNSDETTLPLSAAQGKALNTDKQNATDDTLNTTNKTVVGAINEILPKATGVGKVDPNSDGTGEIFNSYEGSHTNVASGTYSHAEGYGTEATDGYSHAEGSYTTASGYSSHAEGVGTTASGDYSHAEGYNALAAGNYSHAEGNNTTAEGRYSHAEGYFTQTFSSREHAEGSYNVSNTGDTKDLQTRHSVGIGTSSSIRKNAHEIMVNGDHYIYGLGGYDGTNAIEETSQTLQEVVNSKQATITAGTGLEFEGNTLNVTLDTTVFKVVSALPDSPAQGDENKIHLVPAESTGANNAYTEYVWVNSAWEILGEYTSEVDLTPYLKTTDAANTYLSKTDAASTYLNKTDASSTYLNKTDAASTYQPIGDYVTSTELTEGLAGKQNAGSYATTTQLEALQTEVDSKADSALLPTYTTVPELTADYNIPANATTVEKVYDVTVGATLYNITYADGIKWVNDVAPITRVNHRYVVSIINNLGVWGEF